MLHVNTCANIGSQILVHTSVSVHTYDTLSLMYSRLNELYPCTTYAFLSQALIAERDRREEAKRPRRRIMVDVPVTRRVRLMSPLLLLCVR